MLQTLEEQIKLQIGSLVVQIITIGRELEIARARIAELEKKDSDAPAV